MHIKEKYTWIKHVDFIIIDLLCLIVSFILAYYLKFGNFELFSESNWSALFVIVCAVNLILTFYINPYSGIIRRRYYEQFLREIPFLAYQVVTLCIIFYAFKVGTLFSREMMFTMYLIYFLSAHVIKYIHKRILIGTGGVKYRKRKILVVGDKDTIGDVVQNILVGDLIEHEIKYIYLVDSDAKKVKGIPVIKKYQNRDIEEVFIATNPSLIPKEMYQYFMTNGICININMESIIGFEAENTFVQKVGNYNAVSVDLYSNETNKLGYFFVKRCFDIFCGFIGLIVLIPVTIILKIAYMISGDFKSIFYTQKRIGKHGKTIKMFKYRSMVYNADEILEEMLKKEKYRKEWEKNQKFENDPRITKIGKFIRKTSIDELPQLLNVLKGDMSIIGPRPLIEGELELHDGLQLYNKVRPGITGWWACNGRSNIEYRERLELEYYYVHNCSLILDSICILRTIICVLKKEGAM